MPEERINWYKNMSHVNYININLTVNGFDVKARYFQEDIEKIFLPLIKTLSDMRIKKDRRIIAYLAAPPGAGKSTLSLFLAYLSENTKDTVKIQSAAMDGFHYPQEYIANHSVIINGETVPMKSVKGSPESYDLQKLTETTKLLREEKDVRWPIYDRNLHDVVPDAVLIREDIALIEGNWLLLDETNWRELMPFCDYSIFITAEEDMLKERLIQRKISGGTSPDKASEFYEKSDRVNIIRSLKNRSESDCELILSENGKYIRRI